MLVAALVTIGIFWLLFRVLSGFRNVSQLERPTFLVTGLLLVQILLGVGSYLMIVGTQGAPQPLPPVVAVTTAHVAVGALLLASSLSLTFSIYRYVAAASGASAEEFSTAKEAGT
jgi:vacuolar-type H+-ATPase subunit I/STV1